MDRTVSLMVKVDGGKVMTRGFDWWRDHFAREHDAQATGWDDVFHMIAVCFFAGGDYTEYVLASGSSVDIEDDLVHGVAEVTPGVFSVPDDGGPDAPSDRVQQWRTCPGWPHTGHTDLTTPCPLDPWTWRTDD